MLEAKELCAAMKASKINLNSDEDILKIINKIDYFGNGMINYSEFLAACMDFTS